MDDGTLCRFITCPGCNLTFMALADELKGKCPSCKEKYSLIVLEPKKDV
jgi:hypothetical protein